MAVAAGGATLAYAPDAHAQRYAYYGPGPAYGPPRARRGGYWDGEPAYAPVFGLDAEGAVPLNVPKFTSGNTLTGGAGFKARLGEQIRAGYGLHFTPEIAYDYDHLFASDATGDAFSWDMHRAMAGVRVSFGEFVQPVVYGHVGYGWRNTGDPSVSDAAGLAWDVGGALDFRVAPRFKIGAHLEYSQLDATPDSLAWLGIGGHAQFVF